MHRLVVISTSSSDANGNLAMADIQYGVKNWKSFQWMYEKILTFNNSIRRGQLTIRCSHPEWYFSWSRLVSAFDGTPFTRYFRIRNRYYNPIQDGVDNILFAYEMLYCALPCATLANCCQSIFDAFRLKVCLSTYSLFSGFHTYVSFLLYNNVNLFSMWWNA